MTPKSKPAPSAARGRAPAHEPQESALRVIKKYPNRRLYDSQTSSYITLSEVRQMVLAGQSFVVRDAKTAEDLTRSILLQIILEEETGGAPMFTEAMLANIIRFYGHAMQGFMGSYLEKNIQAFMEIQAKLAEQSSTVSPEAWAHYLHQHSPLMQGLMGNYLDQSKNLFLKMQDDMARQTQHMLGVFGIKR